MGVCLIVQRWRIPAPRVLAGLGAGLLLLTGLVHVYYGLSGWTYILGFTLGSSLVIAGLVEAERQGLIGTPRLLVYLGDATYAIYLVHFLALSAIASVLYLGGYRAVPGLALIPEPLWMAGKIGALSFFIIWLRATYPRLREDQLQRFSWLALIPLSLLQIMAVGFVKVAVS